MPAIRWYSRNVGKERKVNEDDPLPTKEYPAGTLNDVSGTITSGGDAQEVLPANSDRRYLLIQNVSDVAQWVDFGTDAVADSPSILLAANGGSLVYEGSFVPSESVSIFGATTGKKFTAKEGV